jgi:Cu2+-exporting ATPase
VGIVKLAKEKNITLEPIKNFQEISGYGISADYNDQSIKIVSPKYLLNNNIPTPSNLLNTFAATTVIILINNKVSGYFELGDEIREESFAAIKTFKKNGIKTLMLTGDNQTISRIIAEKLGIDDFRAEILPHQKLLIIKELQNKNEFVAMVGDGINDAPALAQADIGIAIGAGTDISIETADIVLVKSNIEDIVSLIGFGKATYQKMRQNLLWATLYNVLALPLAGGALYSYGIMLTPAVGAILMSLSTVIVAVNAQFLKNRFFRK